MQIYAFYNPIPLSQEPQNLQKRTESINSEMSIEENKETTEKGTHFSLHFTFLLYLL